MAFFGVGVGTIGGFIPFTYMCYNYTQEMRKNSPEGYEYPPVQDLKWSLVFAAIFLVCHLAWIEIGTPIMMPLCKV